VRQGFKIGGETVAPGKRRTIDIPISQLSIHVPVRMSAHVIHGARPGKTLFVSAAIHGDEIIGVEIIRRILTLPAIQRLRGTLIAVPIVNAYGFLHHSRYLPDRRDLNRSFPGSRTGSLAAQLAEAFMREIVVPADFGIDLHSAAIHRENLPQMRVSPDRADLHELALAFAPPVILPADIRPGSLRDAARGVNTDILLYEAGEALRFDEAAIRIGVGGVLRVMRKLGMLTTDSVKASKVKPVEAQHSRWVRAPEGGILRHYKKCGDSVKKGAVMGIVSNPFGERETNVVAGISGLIIGRTRLPVVNRGDALFHIARVSKPRSAPGKVKRINREWNDEPIFDEDEII
jgi:predicted deacylase